MSRPKNIQLKKLKPALTPSKIGTFRFYSGILIYIGLSLVLNFLFRLTLKLGNLGMTIDQWSLDYQISTYYYILIGFASSGFSFCFTTYLWMSKPLAINRRKSLRLRMAQINPIWIFFGTLMFLLRMLFFFMSIELTIQKDFKVIGFITPIFIYLYCWNLISAVYKSQKAFLICSLIFVTSGFMLSII